MKEFTEFLKQQVNKHSSMQPQDVVKLCYQAAFGAEHLLSDMDKARSYLMQEYAAVEAADMDLYEQISPEVCRINLAAWKYRSWPIEWLFVMFASTAGAQGDRSDREGQFSEYLAEAGKVLEECKAGFTAEEFINYVTAYEKDGIHAVHHSEVYREKEKPAYRIVNSRYLRLLPILKEAAKYVEPDCTETCHVVQKPVCVIVIDGRAASGKSTMAAQLKDILAGEMVHMDDFFLPKELRMPLRYRTAGGNVHYERFIEEVVPYLSKPQAFSYRRFDCSTMDYNGERQVPAARFRIVEGSYSMHPQFGDYGDITVFSDVEPEEQMDRILYRDGSMMAAMFKRKWIPMEEQYFTECEIPQKVMMRV